MELKSGAYDALITQSINEALASTDLVELTSGIDAAEAAEYYSRLVSMVVRRAIATLPEKDRIVTGANLVNSLIAQLAEQLPILQAERDVVATDPTPRILASLVAPVPTGRPNATPQPKTALAQTALLTNAPGEPTLLRQLESELASADGVDILGAFIRFTGIRELLPHIRGLTQRGGVVRVMTTTYTGTTEQRALDELHAAGAQVRVSYDRTATRLHAKAWLFRRYSGFTTVYIGSSNLTHQAQVTGLEWNVWASVVTNAAVVEKFNATFESYWNDENFVPYDSNEFAKQHSAANRASDGGDFNFSFVDLMPKPFQQGLLEQVEFERTLGHHYNLIVAATGTGKTVMAAIDYRNLRATLNSDIGRTNLLFVAHRKEILHQSLHTFRIALRSQSFGELWVDGQRPKQWNHVFASIQSIVAGELNTLPADHFDVVIIDEFHHAEANSYQRLLDWVQPRQLLGLTATPERADGVNVTDRFNGRIAAELRLWDALEQGLLSPFHYYGVADGTDLSEVSWVRGGYHIGELTKLYTADNVWLGKVLQAVNDKVTNPNAMRALGFCVSVDHARFMTDGFCKAGVKAVAVTGDTPREARSEAIENLRTGTIQAIFAVDVFNEGVDIPEVDTVLFLRPTESATLFLQQLGRGLRRTDDGAHSMKDVLTVLDFVGHQRTDFRFDQRFRKLLGGTRPEVEKQIKADFPFLPAGCAINLDTISKEAVLKNIQAAIPTGWADRKREASVLGDRNLASFLEATGLELPDIYAGNHWYTELRRAAGHLTGETGNNERTLGRAIGRMLHIDDQNRLTHFLGWLNADAPPDATYLTTDKRCLATQLHYLLWGLQTGLSLQTGWQQLWHCEPLLQELREMLSLLGKHHGVLLTKTAFGEGVPLTLHASYSRDEILAAFDVGSPQQPPQVREGVKWVEEQQIDLFFITLNKSEKDFSPSTMYHDYAISRDIFHWESQSQTRETSPTGERYINHQANGSRIALFVRQTKKDDYGRTAPYLCAGLANYVSHVGERPMAITWRLQKALPAQAFLSYRAAVA
ncbi:DUF3427 domain-containing protein [Granulosicoccus sp.]|nr:DUF3427 domain-containing protein [Granulosicoccus sp.]